MELCLSWKTFMQSHRSEFLSIQTSSIHIKCNLPAIKKISTFWFCYRQVSLHLDILNNIKRNV